MDEYAGHVGTQISWTPGAEEFEGTFAGFKIIIASLDGISGPSNGLFERDLAGLDVDYLKDNYTLGPGDPVIEIGHIVKFTDPLHGPLAGTVEGIRILVTDNNGTTLEFPQGTSFVVHGGPPGGGRRTRRTTKKSRRNRRRYSRRS